MWCRLQKIKSISLLIISLMLWHFGGLQVYAQARSLQQQQQSERIRKAPLAVPSRHFDALLGELKEVIKEGSEKTKQAPQKGFASIDKLATLKEKLIAENERNHEYFGQIEVAAKAKGLGAEIINRHLELVRNYEGKYQTLLHELELIESAHNQATGLWGKISGKNKGVEWNGVTGRSLDFLEVNVPHLRKHNFDPQNLPHRSLKADQPITPKLTRAEWDRALATDFTDSADASTTAKKTEKSNGPGSAAADGGLTGAPQQPRSTTPPTAADLSETVEVKFTPEIRAHADSLGRNPVKIFNWVHNNIEFVPIWGSIQGAQACLETRACNAFDTSSLLIALLRVSGVPARYQMGTIEVPVEKFKSWAGGFTNAEAAASLFASGGTPSVVRRVDQSGRVVSVKLEHVWIKAYPNYAPSGGAVQKRGDTWIDLDAGFKSHSQVAGLDFETAVPANLRGLVDNLAATATIDPANGLVTRIDSAAVASWLQQNASSRVSYVQNNLPNAPLREIIGGTAITNQTPPVLPANLAFQVVARANAFSALPESLRHKVTFTLASNPGAPESADLWSYTAGLPELAGKNILLLYAPAANADEQFLLQGSSVIPSSVRFVPELWVGNERVAVGTPIPAGSAVASRIVFSAPTISTPAILNTLQAGETAAIGLDLQRVSPVRLQELVQKCSDVAARFRQQNLQGLTARDVADVFLSSNILGWFGLTDQTNHLSALSSGAVTIRYPSAGLFYVSQEGQTLFGAPVSISPAGFQMDIDRDLVISIAKDGDATKIRNLTFIQGVMGSAFEAQLPVTMLSTPDHPASGVATIQALKQANDQGIPIYKINASNAASIIPSLQIDPADLADIQDAINAGQQVLVSRTPVQVNGQSVLGMIIEDPVSGSASFLISGGTNGAIIFAIIFATIVAIVLLAVAFAASPLVAAAAFIIAAVVGVIGAILEAIEGDRVAACFFAYFSIGLAYIALIALLAAFPLILPALATLGLFDLGLLAAGASFASGLASFAVCNP